MIVETTRFGRLEIEPTRVLAFPQGLIGFAHLRNFVLLDHRAGSPFHWLQSIEHAELAFPVAAPDLFVDGYTINAPEGLVALVGNFEPADLWLGAVVTFPHGTGTATLNLKAPLFLNSKTRRGVQAVLDDPDAPIRFPIGTRK